MLVGLRLGTKIVTMVEVGSFTVVSEAGLAVSTGGNWKSSVWTYHPTPQSSESEFDT